MRASTPISPITIKGRLVFISTKRYRLTKKRMERGSGATWTGSPKGVFTGRKHHKPRQGVMANTLNLFRNGAVGFIDWLDLCRFCCSLAYSCFVRATWLSSEEQECCGCCGEDRVVQRRLGAQCHCHRSCECR